MRLILLFFLAFQALAADAQRIVSTAPSITELLFAMGLGPHVVADTIYCNYPPPAATLPKIGGLLKPDVEAILAMKPDLVIVHNQPNNIADQLTRLHVPIAVVDSQNLEAIYSGARVIGKAANATAAAEHFIRTTQTQLEQIGLRPATRSKPAVVFIVGHTPGRLEGLIAGSGTSYFSDLLRYAGGTNTFGSVAAPYPKISLEEIIARDPDVIIELSGDNRSKISETLALWQGKTMLKAVREKRVYAVDSTPFLVPGPRAVDASKQLLHLLHPDL